jgi:hypothetical protein
MIWPLVRALARQGTSVTVVAASSHAALCQREVGGALGACSGAVAGLSTEQPRFSKLWAGQVAAQDVDRHATTVLSMVADGSSEPGNRWFTAARIMFANAKIIAVGAPGSASRNSAWAQAQVPEHGSVPLVANPNGPIVLFVGAGGASKRWPQDRWTALAQRLATLGAISLLAGPVESERLFPAQRDAFDRAGGTCLGFDRDVQFLADILRGARVFIGADTGPTHLAAQLGVPTLALFGPTDPNVWAPVGPRVRVIAPEHPRTMDWLDIDRVVLATQELLR